MVSWAGNNRFQTLVTVDSFVENGAVWVEDVKDRVGVHLLTSRVHADLEVRLCTPQQLLEIRSLEDSDLDNIVLVFK